MCATKALLAGDADEVSEIYRERVVARGFGSHASGWSTAYGDAPARDLRATGPTATRGPTLIHTWKRSP